MSIWFADYNIEDLKGFDTETIHTALGIEFTDISENTLSGKMPVDHRTKQPAGVLHGGASCVLAESLGSFAATLVVDPEKYYCVGQSITANHIRPGLSGYVYGVAKPIHIGRKSHVWDITIVNEEQKLVCSSRLTMAVVEK